MTVQRGGGQGNWRDGEDDAEVWVGGADFADEGAQVGHGFGDGKIQQVVDGGIERAGDGARADGVDSAILAIGPAFGEAKGEDEDVHGFERLADAG